MSNSSVEQFYDDFSHKLIKDYLTGNRRMEQAIQYAVSRIPQTASAILDIGCGIGWSSHELVNHYPDKQVKAVDLSRELLTVGKTLFSQPNISFFQADVTSPNFTHAGKYDAVLMLDVYEHIPTTDRTAFHQAIDNLLNPQGVVILTCPSMYHQQWLRTERPEGLQPVDEDVTLEVLTEFAEAVRGEVIDFSYVSVWQQYDYLHAQLQKHPETWGARARQPTLTKKLALETQAERAQRIEQSPYAADFRTEIKEAQVQPGKFGKLLNRLK